MKLVNNIILKFSRISVLSFQMMAVSCIILMFEIWQIYGFGRFSYIFYLFGIIFFVISSVKSIKFSKNEKTKKNTIVLMILEILVLFVFLVNNTDISNILKNQNMYILVAGIFLVFIIQGMEIYHALHNQILHFKLTKEICVLVVIGVMISLFLNIECFNSWPRWDSFSYFNAIDKLSVANIFQPGDRSLLVCGHIGSSFSLFSLLFQSIPGITDLNALYLMNMFLMAIDFVLFYLIFKLILPKSPSYMYILFAIVGASSPYVLGTVYVINPEKVFLTGILLFLYSLLSKNRLLCIIAAFVVCNAKETGVPVIAMMVFIQLVNDFIQKKTWKQKIKQINWAYYISIALIGICWFFQYKQINWAETVKSDVQVTFNLLDGAKFNAFEFSKLHIGNTLQAALIANFNWIFSLSIVSFLFLQLILVLKRKRKVSDVIVVGIEYWIFIGGGITLLGVICAFVTYPFFRYYTPFFAFLYILGICSLDYVLSYTKIKRWMKTIFISGIAVLLFVQSYITIDPIMLSMFPTLNMGEKRIVTLPIPMQNFSNPAFMDCANYNRQIMYFDKALDKVYAEIKWNPNTKVLLSDEYVPKEGLGSCYSIWGYGYACVEPKMWGRWDSKKKNRYLSYNSNNSIDPEYVSERTYFKTYTDVYKNVYYVEMPWGESTVKKIENNNSVSLHKTVEYKGWKFKIYKID